MSNHTPDPHPFTAAFSEIELVRKMIHKTQMPTLAVEICYLTERFHTVTQAPCANKKALNDVFTFYKR